MSAWGVRWNPWSSSYSSLEADQMRFIHKAYCEAMEIGEEDLPAQLKMDDNFYPIYRPSPADFDEHTFMRKMQNVVGLLRNPAEAIISSICAYQKERSERIAFSGYLNDPRTLLLEEFKDWAMRTLAPSACTTESILNEVRRRHSYVLRLQHGQQGLFHSGNGERSLMGTLKDVRKVIETRILPAIEAERAHSSAREQLHTLEARGTDGLMHGVQFLFYVLRNTPNTPADCTISNLQAQQHAGMKDAMQSKSGQMLQVLLTTPSFRTLFPEAPSSQGDLLRPPLLTIEEEKEMTHKAVFCDNQAKALIPSVLSRNQPLMTPAEFLSQSHSGVVPLRTEAATNAYDTFTRLHGLLKLLADLLVSCRKARQLAGPGGDLLVYGPGGEEVRRLMQSLEFVQTEISRLVSKLTQIGVRELDRLKPNQERGWRYSFSKVLPLENYIAHDFGACVEPIQRIYANADPLHVQKLYRQFREATGLWVQENNSICRQVYVALGAKYIERAPTSQRLSVEGENENQTQKRIEYLPLNEDESKPQEETRPLMLASSLATTINANASNMPNAATLPNTGDIVTLSISPSQFSSSPLTTRQKKSLILSERYAAEQLEEQQQQHASNASSHQQRLSSITGPGSTASAASASHALMASSYGSQVSSAASTALDPVALSRKSSVKSNQSHAGEETGSSTNSFLSQSKAIKGLQSAANLVSWAVGGRKASNSSESPQNSSGTESDDDHHKENRLVNGNVDQGAGAPSAWGVLDVLLLVRQSIQRVGQLSWGVRTSYHTSAFDDENADAFIFLCAIYEGVHVSCASNLLVQLQQHRKRLSQTLQKNLACILRCIYVIQRRLVEEEEGKCLRGLSLVYQRLETLLQDFETELGTLMNRFQRLLQECLTMKNGIATMPLLHQKESKQQNGSTPPRRASAAMYAYNSINALATSIGGKAKPSAAILSHGEYMTEMNSQMDLHWNSISHLLQSLQGTVEAVATVSDRLRECAKDTRNKVPSQQLDYIFEYNYEGFFRQTTKDLQIILSSF